MSAIQDALVAQVTRDERKTKRFYQTTSGFKPDHLELPDQSAAQEAIEAALNEFDEDLEEFIDEGLDEHTDGLGVDEDAADETALMREFTTEELDNYAATGEIPVVVPPAEDTPLMREFTTGANRDTAEGKLDYEGFYSPLVVEAFATYMNFNRETPHGTRDSDNWQKGIPTDVYMKSAFRHFIDWWKYHRGHAINEGIIWALCGLLFNAQGYLHELLSERAELLQYNLEDAIEEREFRAQFKK